MIQINLLPPPPPRSSFARPVMAAFFAAALAAALLYINTGDETAPAAGEGRAVAERASRPASAKKRPPSPAKNRRLRAAGFVRYGGAEFAMLVSGRKTLWVTEGQKAFGVAVSEIKEEGVLVSRGPGAEFLPIK